jgi:hypothetical protein
MTNFRMALLDLLNRKSSSLTREVGGRQMGCGREGIPHTSGLNQT